MKKSLFFFLFAAIYINCSISQTLLMKDTTIRVCGGMFYDSGGSAGSYSNGENKTMTLVSDNANRLSFNFQSFATESCCDYLDIFDGPTNAYPLIGRYLGTNSPGIINSTDTAITFVFHSDGSSNNLGWSANISCTTAPLVPYLLGSGTINTCSGIFYDGSGPASNYLNNVDDSITFCTASLQTLTFTFTNFNLSNDDTLFAYDGNNASSPLIGAYTGTILPEVIYAKSGSCVTFRFKSNGTTVSSGWKAVIACSAILPVQNFYMSNGTRYTCGGTFYDDGGSTASYSANQSKTMTFFSDNGNRLNFNFQSFATESCCDYLDIYDGPSTLSPYLGRFLGTSSPGNILSTHNSLTFYFFSDGSNSSTGWSATINCTTPSLTAYDMTSGMVNTCEGVFYDNGGLNANYPNNEHRTMSFCSSNNEMLIMQFSHLNLDLLDTLFAYDGIDTTAALIGIYTGTEPPETIYSKSGHCITFKFVSNSTTNASGWKAFIACDTIAPIQNVSMGWGTHFVCNANFYDEGGISQSYSNSQNRVMTLVSDNGNRLNVNFQTFATESCCDYLDIYDGSSTSAPYLGRMIGTPAIQSFVSSGTSLTFKFISDASNSNLGWSASVNCTTPIIPVIPMTSGTINTCNAVFYDNGGSTANYPNNENRIMTFCSDTSTFIKIHFSTYNFNVSAGDSLFVYDGANVYASLLAVLSGTSVPEDISSISGNCLTFKFISNATTTTSGWQGFISCSSTPPVNPAIFNMGNGVRYTCNARFYDSGGQNGNYVSSENKIQSFCSNSACPISAIFSSFATEGSPDVLTIYDGIGTTSTILGSYGGSTNPGTITSFGNCLTFKFVSDGSITNTGWSALLTCDTASFAILPANHACAGDTITLTANSGIAYLWSNGETTQSVKATSSGIYSVTVTSASGCNLVSAPATLTFYALPSASITPSGATTFCEGNNVMLSAPVGNTYHWSNGSASQAITVTQQDDYKVTITNANGCKSISNTISVVVNPLPTATISHSGSTTFCEGDSLLLQGSIGNGFTYQWKNDNVNIQNATLASYTVNQAGSYSVEITNSCGTVQSSATVINITLKPVATITPNGTTTFCEGNAVVLSANIGSGYSYKWLKDGTIISSAINSNYTANSNGDYAVITTNSCGSDTSVKTTITVNSLPIANAGIDINIPYGTSTTLAGTATGDSGNYSYSWTPSTLLDNPASATSLTHNLTSTTTFYLFVTDNTTSCMDNDTVIVSISGSPLNSVANGTPTSICLGATSQLNSTTTGGSGNYLYTWSSNPIGSPVWTSTLSNPIVQPTVSTTYNVSVNDGSNIATSSVVITVNNNPAFTPMNDVSICNGNSVTLTSSGGTAYQWNTGLLVNHIIVAPTSNTTYTVTISNQFSCSATDDVVVTVLATPVAIAGNDISLCNGSNLTLHASGGTSYQWSPVNTLNNASTANPVATPTATTTYCVTVTNNGCSANDCVTVTVATALAKPEICMVTVDSTSTYNIISWDLPNTSAVDSVFIYRENTTNTYIKIAAKTFVAKDFYNDYSATPNSRSYRYKIAILDTCGNISMQDTAYKVSYLQATNAMGGTINLFFEQLLPVNYAYVYVYRGTNCNNLVLIDSISSSQNYTDLTPLAPSSCYKLETRKVMDICAIPALNGLGDKYSLSNCACVNYVSANSSLIMSKFVVYPNPANDQLTLILNETELKNIVSLSVYNVQGQEVQQILRNDFKQNMEVSKLAKGVYFLKLTTTSNTYETKFVKD